MLPKILEFTRKTVQAIKTETCQLLAPRQTYIVKEFISLKNKYSILPGCDAVALGKWCQGRP